MLPISCNLVNLTFFRELGEYVQSLNDPSSPFCASSVQKSSDATVYPPSEGGNSDGPAGKKRKLDEGTSEQQLSTQEQTTSSPRYLQTVKANEHMTQKVYGVLKKECEELAHLTVCVR